MKITHSNSRLFIVALFSSVAFNGVLLAADAPATAAPAAPATAAPAATPAPAAATAATPAVNTAIVPVPQSATGNYQKVHQKLVDQAHKGGIDVLFLGDSITDFWVGVSSNRAPGKEVWDKYFGNMKAADFGYSADRTQHVLWRMQNGEGEGFSPKVIVLMIGTNNTGPERTSGKIRNTVPEAIEGVTAVVTDLRKRWPDAKILLLAIFPRSDNDISPGQIVQINQAISALDDGKHIFSLDIGRRFLQADGTLSTDIMADHLHPTAAGYVIWAEAIKEPLANLLAGKDIYGFPIPAGN